MYTDKFQEIVLALAAGGFQEAANVLMWVLGEIDGDNAQQDVPVAITDLLDSLTPDHDLAAAAEVIDQAYAIFYQTYGYGNYDEGPEN